MRDDVVLADVVFGAMASREYMVSVIVEWPDLPAPIYKRLCEAIDELEAITTTLDKFIGSGRQHVH